MSERAHAARRTARPAAGAAIVPPAASAMADAADPALTRMEPLHYAPSALGAAMADVPRPSAGPAGVADSPALPSPSAPHAPSQPPSPPPAAQDRHATPPNRTGLPDALKRGIEHLSGVNLDRVRVHYRSSRPARYGAAAYALGGEIHLAPGQDRHLPHEAWHVAQQALGRVAPTLQWKDGPPGNESSELEREADRMGGLALRAGRGAEASPAHSHPRRPTTPGVLQRTPLQALQTLPEYSNLRKRLATMLANANWINDTFPLIRSNQETYRAIKGTLLQEVEDLRRQRYAGPDFVATWNNGLEQHELAYIPRDIDKYYVFRPKHDAPFDNSGGADKLHEQWLKKPLRDKYGNPDRKFAKSLPILLAEQSFPDDVTTALKLYFAHTANFVPPDHIGRDYRSVEHGQYYRSSNDPVRQDNTALLKEAAREDARRSGETLPDKFTAQVTNQALHVALIEHGYLKDQISATRFAAASGKKPGDYAIYQSILGSHTGSLGLIQNVYRTVQVGTRQAPPPGRGTAPPDASDARQEIPLNARVDETLLAPATGLNYHDLLLDDRGSLVRETAAEIDAMYDPSMPGCRVVPIQSPTHASLILDLVDETGANPLQESEWRELFIFAFNKTAADMKLQTRATHRGSFGFLFPTVSSVGGPVRIWPGLTPPNLFKELIAATLARLPRFIRVGDKRLAFQRPELPGDRPDLASTSKHSKTPLDREALKTAVRYAQDTMRATIAVTGSRRFARWIAIRLQRNLQRAKFLLERPPPAGRAERETAWLKSASVIENLMEYSYLLEAFNAHALDADAIARQDPYPAYLRNTLKLDGKQHDTATFYLDSGMQAIVTANLLARVWAIENKRLELDQEIESIDLYSYFEYASVDRENFNIRAINRNRQGYLDQRGLDEQLDLRDTFDEDAPGIIAADLNPVLTSQHTRQTQVPYADVFKRFANQNKGGTGTLSDTTVPIVDVTNASLGTAAQLQLDQGYENFIIVESLSKHQQLGADKFTMGRLSAIGSPAFLKCANTLIKPIEQAAFHRLPATYRLRMDQIYYGDPRALPVAPAASLLANAGRFDAFMVLMGFDRAWEALDKRTDGGADAVSARQRAASDLLDKALRLYVGEVVSTTTSRFDLQAAYRALPDAERSRVMAQIHSHLPRDSVSSKASTDPTIALFYQWSESHTSTGITNVGNTCYLAATLNLLAMSPYRSLFLAQAPVDPLAELRARINAVLTGIVAGQAIDFETVADLLVSLDHHGLLEHTAAGLPLPLNAQRDPSELLGQLIDSFGTAAGPNYQLTQIYRKHLDIGPSQVRDNANPAQYSTLTEIRPPGAQPLLRFPTIRTPDWTIKLSITDANNLRQALRRHLAEEPIAHLTGVLPATQQRPRNLVLESTGTSQLSFGDETPPAITIQLIRWRQERGRIAKDSRPIDMPRRFVLNGHLYRIQTVIYHLGLTPDAGHYTTSTRDALGRWQYRDDRSVARDLRYVERAPYGYLYTYADEGPASQQQLARELDITRPPPDPVPPVQPGPAPSLDPPQAQAGPSRVTDTARTSAPRPSAMDTSDNDHPAPLDRNRKRSLSESRRTNLPGTPGPRPPSAPQARPAQDEHPNKRTKNDENPPDKEEEESP